MNYALNNRDSENLQVDSLEPKGPWDAEVTAKTIGKMIRTFERAATSHVNKACARMFTEHVRDTLQKLLAHGLTLVEKPEDLQEGQYPIAFGYNVHLLHGNTVQGDYHFAP